MEGVAVLVNAGILYAACGLTLYFLYFLIRLIYNYFKTKDKLSTKRSLKNAVIIIVVAVSLFYLIRFAGEYRKLDLSEETATQLLNVDITQIESGQYYLEITKDETDEEFRVYVRKYSGDTSLYNPPYYYNQIERLFEHRLTDKDSLVVIFARESDRDFKQIPIVQKHLTEVGIVQKEEVLEISYWDDENSDEVLQKTINYISEIGLENNKSE